MAMEDNMADKKTVTPEEKQLAAEKHVDGLVKKALVALDEMRKLNQEQVDYIVAKLRLQHLTRTVSLHNTQLKKLVVVYLKIRRQKIYLPVNT